MVSIMPCCSRDGVEPQTDNLLFTSPDGGNPDIASIAQLPVSSTLKAATALTSEVFRSDSEFAPAFPTAHLTPGTTTSVFSPDRVPDSYTCDLA